MISNDQVNTDEGSVYFLQSQFKLDIFHLLEGRLDLLPDNFAHILTLSQDFDGCDDFLYEFDLQVALVETGRQMRPYFFDTDIIDISLEDGVALLNHAF